jgi:hypothetical protein
VLNSLAVAGQSQPQGKGYSLSMQHTNQLGAKQRQQQQQPEDAMAAAAAAGCSEQWLDTLQESCKAAADMHLLLDILPPDAPDCDSIGATCDSWQQERLKCPSSRKWHQRKRVQAGLYCSAAEAEPKARSSLVAAAPVKDEEDCNGACTGGGGGIAAAAAAGVLSCLHADVSASWKVIKPRVKGAIILPLPGAKAASGFVPNTGQLQQQQQQQAVQRPLTSSSNGSSSSSNRHQYPFSVGSQQLCCGKTCTTEDDKHQTQQHLDRIENSLASVSSSSSHRTLQQQQHTCLSGTVHSRVISFALTEPRVKGVLVMSMPASGNSSSNMKVKELAKESSVASFTVSSSSSSSHSAVAKPELPLAVDPWELDGAVRRSRPAWSFSRRAAAALWQTAAAAAAATDSTICDSGSWHKQHRQQQQQILQPDHVLVKPRQGLGVLLFGSRGGSGCCMDESAMTVCRVMGLRPAALDR